MIHPHLLLFPPVDGRYGSKTKEVKRIFQANTVELNTRHCWSSLATGIIKHQDIRKFPLLVEKQTTYWTTCIDQFLKLTLNG